MIVILFKRTFIPIKNWITYLLILFAPIILMVVVNEVSRINVSESPHEFKGRTAINSAQRLNDKCTWACHYNTNHCKKYHVKMNSTWFPTTDKAYFGIINLLESTQNYNFMNVLLFLFLIPLLMWLLLIKVLRMQAEIKQLKKSNK